MADTQSLVERLEAELANLREVTSRALDQAENQWRRWEGRANAAAAELDTLRKRVEELEAARDDPNLRVLVEDLRPYAERQIGSLRIDMSDVRSILALFDASRPNKEDGNG